MVNKYKIFALISVIIIVLGPIFGVVLDKITLFDNNVLISTDSNSNIQKAFAYPFTLTKDQKLTMEFSVNTRNVSATLKIFTKPEYDTYNSVNTTNPNSHTGESFTYSEFGYQPYPDPSSLTHPVTSVSITEDGYYYCEFAGYTSSNNLVSRPGDYVVVVYGYNSQAPTWTNVTFNIKLRIDGPGQFLGGLFITIGVSALVATMIFAALSYLKKTRRALL
jgi:hypothetical protein